MSHAIRSSVALSHELNPLYHSHTARSCNFARSAILAQCARFRGKILSESEHNVIKILINNFNVSVKVTKVQDLRDSSTFFGVVGAVAGPGSAPHGPARRRAGTRVLLCREKTMPKAAAGAHHIVSISVIIHTLAWHHVASPCQFISVENVL